MSLPRLNKGLLNSCSGLPRFTKSLLSLIQNPPSLCKSLHSISQSNLRPYRVPLCFNKSLLGLNRSLPSSKVTRNPNPSNRKRFEEPSSK